LFTAQRAAASVVGAEAYFRAAYAGAYSWNVRDRHMTETIEAIAAHAEALAGRSAPVVVWAHNSHVGDARSTDRADQGELNIGQLMRQRHGDGAFLVGFLTGSGTVLTAPEWGGRGRVYDLRPPLKESYAALLKEQGLSRALLLTRDTAVASALAGPRLQRAVGVVYARETERQSHYFKARMARQFDAVIYLEQTRAVTPLP
jgi:erythromycin esterase-like protein